MNISCLHQTPAPGQNYYRLRQMDYDGSTSYSPGSTARFDDASGLQVFPTVTTGLVNVKSEKGPVSQVQVFDALGKPVLQATDINQVDLSSEMPGVYFLTNQRHYNYQTL